MAHLSDRQKAELVRQHQDGVPWTRLAEHSGVAVRTLQRWAARIETGQLARAPRRDKGSPRTAAELVTAIEALAVRRPAPTIAYIHRRIGDIAGDRGLSAPGYTTVREIVRALDPGLTTLADGGDAAYRDRFELVYRRTTSAPNEQWQMDHTLLDVMILNDRQQPVRPWLTIVLDDYSRAIAGYTMGVSAPTAENSALAFHQAVARKRNPAWVVSGLPDILYSDHGSDFTSARIEHVCLDLHVRLIHSRVGVPQGRGKIGESSRVTDRPQWLACLDYLRPGDILKVRRLDRLAGSERILIETLQDLDARQVNIVSLTEPMIDTTTPMGRALYGIVAVFAQLRVDTIRDNTQRGLDYARSQGRVGGRPSVMTPERVATAERMRAESQSWESIGRVLGVGASSVRRALDGRASVRE